MQINKLQVISAIYQVKAKKNNSEYSKFNNRIWYGLRYKGINEYSPHPNEIREYILIFNGNEPGQSYSCYTTLEAKRLFKIEGKPIPFKQFEKFFKDYRDKFQKNFYYDK